MRTVLHPIPFWEQNLSSSLGKGKDKEHLKALSSTWKALNLDCRNLFLKSQRMVPEYKEVEYYLHIRLFSILKISIYKTSFSKK